MLLIIDNYDSFTYILADYILQQGCKVRIVRPANITINEIVKLAPRAAVISSGSGYHGHAGIVVPLIKGLVGSIPLLGIGSGYLALAEVFGGNIVKADRPRHGKTAEIYHHGEGLFLGLPLPFRAACYHSLVVDSRVFPSVLEIAAFSAAGEMMALKHRHYPVYGVQFHPASILTEYGERILKNFISMAGEFKLLLREEGGTEDGAYR